MSRKADISVATEFYTVNQLADLFQVTPMTIYRMIKQGKLAYHSIGRVKRHSATPCAIAITASTPATAHMTAGRRAIAGDGPCSVSPLAIPAIASSISKRGSDVRQPPAGVTLQATAEQPTDADWRVTR